jgi:hypothetical protein
MYTLYSFVPLFKVFFTIVLLNDYLKRTFPKKYEKIESMLISYTYNLIYIYSKCQIIYNKIYCKTTKLIESSSYLKELVDSVSNLGKDFELEYINNGNVIAKYDPSLADITDLNENSFCIFSDLNKKENNLRINKKIIHNFPITTDYEISNISFILLEVTIGDKKYKINLKDDKQNYYLVDNMFDKKFFIYYVMNFDSDKLTYDYINSHQLILNFIDNNVEQKQIDMTNGLNSIVIQKDSYLINEK